MVAERESQCQAPDTAALREQRNKGQPRSCPLTVTVWQSSTHRFAAPMLICNILLYSPGIVRQGNVAKENYKNPEGQRLLRRAGIQ